MKQLCFYQETLFFWVAVFLLAGTLFCQMEFYLTPSYPLSVQASDFRSQDTPKDGGFILIEPL
jgi:hypothetical protein